MSNPGVSREYELSGLRILVVDDEPDARELLVVVLQQYGAKVLAVESTDRALEVMDHWKPDVIVSDIGMPGQDGYELMRASEACRPSEGGIRPPRHSQLLQGQRIV